MRPLFLFEFCDQLWVPSGPRECLFETMDACNSGLRSFNLQVARSALQCARKQQLHTIIELGAGRAPVTLELTKHEDTEGIRLIACDLVPNVAAYRKLEQDCPDRVFPIYTPVDLLKPHAELNNAVLVLATAMHHIPFQFRLAVLKTLTETNSRITIFEPLARTWLSMFLAALSFFVALMLPITFVRRPGRLRRVLWCWAFPVVPYMFAWDGVTSCLRQWRIAEWRAAFAQLPSPPTVEYVQGFNSLKISWTGLGPQAGLLPSPTELS